MKGTFNKTLAIALLMSGVANAMNPDTISTIVNDIAVETEVVKAAVPAVVKSGWFRMPSVSMPSMPKLSMPSMDWAKNGLTSAKNGLSYVGNGIASVSVAGYNHAKNAALATPGLVKSAAIASKNGIAYGALKTKDGIVYGALKTKDGIVYGSLKAKDGIVYGTKFVGSQIASHPYIAAATVATVGLGYGAYKVAPKIAARSNARKALAMQQEEMQKLAKNVEAEELKTIVLGNYVFCPIAQAKLQPSVDALNAALVSGNAENIAMAKEGVKQAVKTTSAFTQRALNFGKLLYVY